jgi:hypothetical protein
MGGFLFKKICRYIFDLLRGNNLQPFNLKEKILNERRIEK